MHGFSRHDRLRKRAEFLLVSEQGRKLHTTHFIILRKDSPLVAPRIGITVSRKVGNAVVRNHLKRLVREFFRQNKQLFAAADYNIIAKKSSAAMAFRDVCNELGSAMQRLPKQQC